jgi:NADH-quinone oxidoreductase subunit A
MYRGLVMKGITVYWPFIAYVAGVVAIVSAMLGLSYILGQRHAERATSEPYESGILITGSARVRYYARFYIVAMIFVVFDLESVYLFSWSVAAKELGWSGYYTILVFSAILLVALAYIWRMGGLDFGPRFRRFDTLKGRTQHHESAVQH